MAEFISERQDSIGGLANQTEIALIEVNANAKAGIVPNSIKNTNRSCMYLDGGVLKFYNADAVTVQTVTLS